MQPEHQRRMRVCVRANQMDPDISVNTRTRQDGRQRPALHINKEHCNSFAYLMLRHIPQFPFIDLITLQCCSVGPRVCRQFESNISVTLREDRELRWCLSDNRIIRPWGKSWNESKSNLESLISCLFSQMEHKHYTWCVSIINGPEVFWPC